MLKKSILLVFVFIVLFLCMCIASQKGLTTSKGIDQNSTIDSTKNQSQNKNELGEHTYEKAANQEGLSPASQLIIKACDNYMTINPQSPKLAEVLSLKASVFYNNNHYEESRQVYNKIIENYPQSSQEIEAIRMIAQSYYQEKKFDDAQSWFRKLRDIAGEGGDKQEAIERIAESIFRMAETFEDEEKYEDAAAQYERVALEFPNVAIADVSLINAGNAYEKIAEWSRAILIYQRLRQKYPDSKMVPKAMFRTAKSYEKMQQWDNAAQTYLQLVAKYPHSEMSTASMYNAGFCFENAEKFAEAAATFEKHAMSFPSSEDAADVLFRAGELYGKLNDWPSVTRVNQEFSRRYGNDMDRVVQALCMVGVAFYMQNEQNKAIEQLNNAVSTYTRLRNPSPVNKYYAAKAQFTLAEIYHESHNKIKLTLPRTAYKKQLKAKSDILEKVIQEYSKVLQYNISEWTTRSIYQIGQAYEDFALSVFQQERPENVSLKERLALELGIAKAVEEYFVNHAMHYHEQNVKIGIKENIEDKYILNSKKKLTYLPFMAGDNYLQLVNIALQSENLSNLDGFALIAQKLQMLQKIAPFQEEAIDLFLKCLELGTMYQEFNEFYKKASELITKTSFTVGETYADISTIAREAPIPQSFDPYERFVYKTKLLKQIETYEDNALTNYLKTVKIAEAYNINDDYVIKTKTQLSKLLFNRGRCYDLLCINLFTDPPYPSNTSDAEKDEYRARFEEIALRFQEQAFEIYKGILEYSEKKYATGEYLNHAYVRLYQNFPSEYGVKNEKIDNKSISSGSQWKCTNDSVAGWLDLEFDDSKWHHVSKENYDTSISISGFPGKIPTPMWLSPSKPTTGSPKPDKVFFRRTFYIDNSPHEADLFLSAFDNFSVYLNGEKLQADSSSSVQQYSTKKWNIMGRLRNGKNNLSIKVTNNNKTNYGLFVYLSLSLSSSEYLPVFPGTKDPVDKKKVEEGAYVFPYIKNFSLNRDITAGNGTGG